MFKHAGQIRKYNITKNEWVLKGDTVIYADFTSIRDTLDYDFATEKQFSYEGLTVEESVRHLAKFASDIWQIHPFCEGKLQQPAKRCPFYNGIFGNVLRKYVAWHEPRAEKQVCARGLCGRGRFPKCQRRNLKVPIWHFGLHLGRLALLELIVKNPNAIQQELADASGKSLRTVKRLMKSLQDKNYIRRENGKRYGKWEFLG